MESQSTPAARMSLKPPASAAPPATSSGCSVLLNQMRSGTYRARIVHLSTGVLDTPLSPLEYTCYACFHLPSCVCVYCTGNACCKAMHPARTQRLVNGCRSCGIHKSHEQASSLWAIYTIV